MGLSLLLNQHFVYSLFTLSWSSTVDSIFEEEGEEPEGKKKKKRSAKVAVLQDDDIDLFGTKEEDGGEADKRDLTSYGEDNSELLE